MLSRWYALSRGMGIVGLMKYRSGVEELPALLGRQSRGSDGNSGVMPSRSLGRVGGALGYPWVWRYRSRLGVRQVGSPCPRAAHGLLCASSPVSGWEGQAGGGDCWEEGAFCFPALGFSVLLGKCMQADVQSTQRLGFPLPGIHVYPIVGFFT